MTIKTMVRIGMVLVLTGALAAPAVAQMGDPASAAESRERVAALEWLVGEWEGSGWIAVRGAGRQSFTSTETVESRLDGRLLLVEGLHHNAQGTVVHHALGAITWNANADRYVFHTWLGADGGGGADNPLELTDAGFRWMPQSEQGASVVFDVRNEDGQWVETGTVTLPDGREFQFFEMRLTRVTGSR